MSILRRKGKHFKDRKRDGFEGGRGAKHYSELLSNDIQTLLQVFHDEAAGATVSSHNSIANFCLL